MCSLLPAHASPSTSHTIELRNPVVIRAVISHMTSRGWVACPHLYVVLPIIGLAIGALTKNFELDQGVWRANSLTS